MIRQQAALLKGHIDFVTHKIQVGEGNKVEYPGAVLCKRKLYQGVKIYFEQMFHFELDNLERSRIFWADGEIIHGTL